jgi:hypothetical protein
MTEFSLPFTVISDILLDTSRESNKHFRQQCYNLSHTETSNFGDSYLKSSSHGKHFCFCLSFINKLGALSERTVRIDDVFLYEAPVRLERAPDELWDLT